MRGIECMAPSGYDAKLKHLLNNIPLTDYDWYISETEIIRDDKNQIWPLKMNGHELQNHLEESNLVIFINMQAYPKGANTSELNVYEDFLNSTCEIIILIYDVRFVEIYVKDKSLIMKFIENMEKCGCTQITIKTDKDDTRTRLSVI